MGRGSANAGTFVPPAAPADEREDHELVLVSAQGDGAAFGVLVRRHIRAATLLAAQLLGDQDDAEDVVQRAFILVYERAHAFDVTRPFTPWLYGIVRRLAANKRARAARRARLFALWGRFSGGVVEPSDTGTDTDTGLDLERMHQLMAALSPMQRACFELVAVRGFATGEAASMHGISESTVRQHVFRARRALSEAMQLQQGGSE